MTESAKPKGVRLWLSASDVEFLLMIDDPSLNREQLESRLESMTKEDLIFLIRKFAVTHQRHSNPGTQIVKHAPMSMPAPISVEPEVNSPDLEDLESLDFN